MFKIIPIISVYGCKKTQTNKHGENIWKNIFFSFLIVKWILNFVYEVS